MQIPELEFVEKTDYSYAVAVIRANEKKLLGSTQYSSLINTTPERFPSVFTEFVGIRYQEGDDPLKVLQELEVEFTNTFLLIKSLLLEDEYRRLISLPYDYELLKMIIKGIEPEGRGIFREISKRSNYSYPLLKSLLESGKSLETGSIIYNTYLTLSEIKEVSGAYIDHICDVSYFTEGFNILEKCPNSFIKRYFILTVDAKNLTTMLRLKLRDGKRNELRKRFLPLGSIDLSHFEQGLDLNMESFASRIIFSPLSGLLHSIEKGTEEEEQVAIVERLIDEYLMGYLKESMMVVFGVEPLFAYLWAMELQVKNLSLIILSKSSGIEPERIRPHVRGAYV